MSRLIALMLGRLHMTVDECLFEFQEISKIAFAHGIHNGKMRAFCGVFGFNGYSGTKLAKAFQKVVTRKTGDSDTPLITQNDTQNEAEDCLWCVLLP
jgi:hypothetical protein